MELKIGTNIILEPVFSETFERFKCKVVEQKDNMLYIDYPTSMNTNKTSFLMDGAQFKATFTDESKNAFAFQTEVLGRVKSNIPMIMLTFPPREQIIKIQRREFVRVETPVDVAVEYEGSYYQFVTDDISAGGLAIILNKEVDFREFNQVELSIVLPFVNGEIVYIETSASVVRILEKDNRKLASIQFVDTDDTDRQQIVRFCFERQLMQRKKEMHA